MNNSVKIALLLMLIVIFLGEFNKPPGGEGTVPPMRRPYPEKAAPLPLPPMRVEGQGELRHPRRSDPQFTIIAEGPKQNSVYTGTAFSIRDDGLWITAKHVTKGCDRLVLLVKGNRGYRIEGLVQHPRSDVSLFKTRGGAEPLKINRGRLSYNQKGYHIGYPRGEAGEVYSQLMGRRVMKTKGHHNARENVLVWTEMKRFPDNNHPLGGLSGGPTLDENGNVIGVLVAGSIRRGRAYSSLPESIDYLLERTDTMIPETVEAGKLAYLLNEDGFSEAGRILRKKLTIAKVVCLID